MIKASEARKIADSAVHNAYIIESEAMLVALDKKIFEASSNGKRSLYCGEIRNPVLRKTLESYGYTLVDHDGGMGGDSTEIKW